MRMFDFFFFNDTATTEIYTLSLHDALPIWGGRLLRRRLPVPAHPVHPGALDARRPGQPRGRDRQGSPGHRGHRSEEHTSELQSRQYLVCRLLLEKKKNRYNYTYTILTDRGQ